MILNLKNKTILVVEDEETNFLFIEAILEDTSAKIFWAKNGLEAIDMVKTNDDIDIVLLDIKMPKMNGYEAAEKIKELKKDLPIIAQTAYAMAEDRTKCKASGCDEYIVKPINVDELFGLIEKYI